MTSIRVHQDLVLRGEISERSAFAAALKQQARAPWFFDEQDSAEAERDGLGGKGMLIFKCHNDPTLPPARLVLWPEDNGFSVPNIVPTASSELTIAEYNRLLSDFADRVARPVARQFGYTVSLTSAAQDLEDWTSEEAAAALRRFSAAANKSTGASHPMDERRWFDFIIAVHRSGKDMGTDRLNRWLHEVEGWDEDTAHDLAGEFERSLALLKREAETR